MDKVIHAENKFGDHKSSLPLNGVGLDEAVNEFTNAYIVPEPNGIMQLHGDHPIIERQRRIQENSKGIEKIVESALEGKVKPSQNQAKNIVKKLAYELAKAESEFNGKLEDFTDEQVRKYTSRAGQALGNPRISSFVELVKSIRNMASAKPGDVAYDTNSALAQLIGYVGTRKDKQSLRLEYLQALFQEHSTDMPYISALQKRLSGVIGKQFSPGATIPEILGEVSEYGRLQSQRALAQTEKTHIQPVPYQPPKAA